MKTLVSLMPQGSLGFYVACILAEHTNKTTLHHSIVAFWRFAEISIMFTILKDICDNM